MGNLELSSQEFVGNETAPTKAADLSAESEPVHSAGVRVRPVVKPMAAPGGARSSGVKVSAARPPYETKKRSIAKAISWRLVATIITAGVVYATTGQWKAAGAIAAFDTTIKFAAYFFHERMWVRINFGRHRYTDYQI